MISSVTHFEIYGEEPAKLADFYRNVFGWQVEQMPGVNYWRIQTGSAEPNALHGGPTYRAIPDLNGWVLFVNVASLDGGARAETRLLYYAPKDCRT
jgi:predicted enzyme related to lactoylglutathione lyase